jgi:hypothetical protein
VLKTSRTGNLLRVAEVPIAVARVAIVETRPALPAHGDRNAIVDHAEGQCRGAGEARVRHRPETGIVAGNAGSHALLDRDGPAETHLQALPQKPQEPKVSGSDEQPGKVPGQPPGSVHCTQAPLSSSQAVVAAPFQLESVPVQE